jgi:hypothetical protein
VDRIVLARLPALLPTWRVASASTCSPGQVGADGPPALLEPLRAALAEHHDRRVLAAATLGSRRFRVETTRETEDGREATVDPVTQPLPLAPSTVAYEPGRAIVREQGA